MGVSRKSDLDLRLDAHFATLRSSPLRQALKRSGANWQLYAAVTGSAMAMATSAAAAIIGSGIRPIATNPPANPAASVLQTNRQFANSGNIALLKAAGFPGAAAQAQAPSISPGGVVPLFGTGNTIEPGEWISIYGTNLAAGTATWNGDFPVSLGGASVAINGKPAYLMFVSPGQINLQAPDDTATGAVSVVVTTAAGSATSIVTLNRFAPSFSLLEVPKSGPSYVSGIILRSDGSGAYGKGTYDLLGPTGNFFGYPTVAAKPGDIVELFGVGFGPTTPVIPAGKVFSGAAPVDNPFTLYINNVNVQPTFVGLSSAGLYQINLTVPSGLGQDAVPIQAIVGGMQTQQGVLFSLWSAATAPIYPVSGGPTASPPPWSSFGSGGSGSSGGGSSGGGGSGGGSVFRKKPYTPSMRFPPK